MRLAVFGATGRVGAAVVEQALGRGHEVSALVRHPGRIVRRERLRVEAGDVRDPAAVRLAIAGADAVLSALGQRRLWGVTVTSDAMATILPAMDSEGLRRLVAVSGYGVNDSWHGDLYGIGSWLTITSIMRDKQQMERLIRSSTTQWTIVRPAVLVNGPHTGKYRVGPDLRLSYGSRVSCADVADFMVAQVDRDEFVGQTVGIAPVSEG